MSVYVSAITPQNEEVLPPQAMPQIPAPGSKVEWRLSSILLSKHHPEGNEGTRTMPRTKRKPSPAIDPARFAIRHTSTRRGSRACAVSGKEISTTRSWAIFLRQDIGSSGIAAWQIVADEVAEKHAPELAKLLSMISEGVHGECDSLYGIISTAGVAHVDRRCAKYGEAFRLRQPFDVVASQTSAPVSPRVAQEGAPALVLALNEFYETSPITTPAPSTLADKSTQRYAELDAAKRADRLMETAQQAADRLRRERAERRRRAVEILAKVLPAEQSAELVNLLIAA